MTLTEAADVYERVQPLVEEMDEDLKALRKAESVLKEHFKATGRRRYRNIGCELGTRTTFDQATARELLGPKKTEQCMRPSTTARLHLLAPLNA